MKYLIQETIIIKTDNNEEIRDFVKKELTEEEFLLAKLKDPKLAYWTIDLQGVKRHYRNCELQVTIHGDQITNHSLLSQVKNFKIMQP